MRLFSALFWTLLYLANASQIQIDPDGGYKDVVVKISPLIEEHLCPQIVANLKVNLLIILLK